MALLALTLILSIACWIFLQRNGSTFLSFAIDRPSDWMVQALSYTVSIFLFFVLFHGFKWFSQLFTWNKNGATFGGIFTTALMSVLMLWVGYVGFSYASNIAFIKHYAQLSQAHMKGESPSGLPVLVKVKQGLLSLPSCEWLKYIDPLDNTAQTHLAGLVAYAACLPEAQQLTLYSSKLENCGIAYPSRFKKLFSDEGLRKLIEQGNYASLLESEALTSFLQTGNSQQFLEENFKASQ